MGIIAKPLSYLLIWLYELVGSYGIAILILTVVIKLCLYPLYAKQIKSTMRMTDVQPKVKEIQQKYAKDRELMNQKMMELYKDEGVSMYGRMPADDRTDVYHHGSVCFAQNPDVLFGYEYALCNSRTVPLDQRPCAAG